MPADAPPTATEPDRGGHDRPLRGLRVVDTTDETAWSAARLLADLGADVVRVETPGRRVDPLYATRNANKRSVVLPQPELLGDLLAHADVWFDTDRDRDVDAVRRRFPGLVVVSITPFGRRGPYRDFAVTHPVVFALCGQLPICRLPDRAPLLPPGQPAYEVASAMAAYSALVAVWQRAVTGDGDHLDLSVQEAMIQTVDTGIANASALQGQPVPFSGTRSGHPAYPSADGLVRPLVVSIRQWEALREWVGDPEDLRDEALATYLGRNLHPDVMNRVYTPLFAGTSSEAICEEAQRRNVPATPVMSPAQLLASGPMRERGTFATTVVEGRDASLPAGYYELDDRRVGFRHPAPAPGADTDAVLAALRSGASPFPEPPLQVPVRGGRGEGPLTGLRVLELTQLMAGPETGKLLRDHGADVIRVESRAFPDQSRVFGGPVNMSAQFVTINRGKRSIGIDLTSARGRELFLGLVACSDVVIENLGPGALESMGLGLEVLRRANPGIVLVSSQLFGDHGRWGWWRGFGTHARSIGGQTWLWRYPDTVGDFAENVIFFPDQFAARHGALAALACVTDGGGRHVRVSQADAVINHLAELILQESLEPGSVQARGNRSPDGAPWGVYPCAGEDQWCVITVRSEPEWAALAAVTGHPEWCDDPRFADAASRHACADLLDALVATWTATRPAREVMDCLQRAGVPAAAALTCADLIEDPQLDAHDFVQVILQPGWEPLLVEGDSFRAQHLPARRAEPAPIQGEHTRVIARELLGLTDAEVETLVEAGVLEPPVAAPRSADRV